MINKTELITINVNDIMSGQFYEPTMFLGGFIMVGMITTVIGGIFLIRFVINEMIDSRVKNIVKDKCKK